MKHLLCQQRDIRKGLIRQCRAILEKGAYLRLWQNILTAQIYVGIRTVMPFISDAAQTYFRPGCRTSRGQLSGNAIIHRILYYGICITKWLSDARRGPDHCESNCYWGWKVSFGNRASAQFNQGSVVAILMLHTNKNLQLNGQSGNYLSCHVSHFYPPPNGQALNGIKWCNDTNGAESPWSGINHHCR